MNSKSSEVASRTRSWALMFLATALSCVALVVLVEWGLRIFGPTPSSVFVRNEFSISKFKPNISRVRHPRKTPVRFETNRFGIRDDSQLNPAEADILVFGDSNIAAMHLPFADTIGERIEELFENEVTVANLGLPGYGPDQSLKRLIELSSSSDLRAVVFHFFADNDFGDLFRNNIFSSDDGKEWIERSALDREPMIVWERYKLLQRIWPKLGLSRQDFDQLIAGEDYYNVRWENFDHSVSEYQRYKQGQFTSWLGDRYDAAIANAPLGAEAQEAMRILGFVLSSAMGLLQDNSQCFVLLIQPSEKDLYQRLTFDQTHKGNSYYPRALVDIAISAAKKHQISYIDLFPVFETAPEKFYYTEREYPGDNHWNEKGIGKAAQLIAEYLRKNGCV